MKIRLDELLVQKGFYSTRSKAKQHIVAGDVIVDGKTTKKAGEKVLENASVQVKKQDLYVGRGAYKMEGALKSFNIDPKNKIIVDAGASTGGFTDILLQQGASKVYAIDVGHDQLDEKLKQDGRVINMEGQDIRTASIPEAAGLAVVDLSFISLKLCLENIFALLKPEGEVICLFKPQFEGDKSTVKQGIVKDDATRERLLNDFISWCYKSGYTVINKMESTTPGKKGNIEYLLHLKQ